MINFILFLLALTCFGIAAAWVAENPGSVTMYWGEWRLDTSTAFLLLVIALAIVVAALLYHFIRNLFTAPGRWSIQHKLKQHEKGLTELTYGVASLAASDTQAAGLHTRKAEKLLGKTPITILLAAQIARSSGNEEKTRELLEQLLGFKETEYLAARSLSDAAAKQKQFPRALELARRAHTINPKDNASTYAMVGLYIKLGKWQEATQVIEKDARKGHFMRSDKMRLLGLVHLTQGIALLEQSRMQDAMLHAGLSLKYLRDFTPAVLYAARVFTASGQPDKAVRILHHAWKEHHNPQVATMLKELCERTPKKHARILQAITGHVHDMAALWTCSSCGFSNTDWTVHCPSCDGFDTLK